MIKRELGLTVIEVLIAFLLLGILVFSISQMFVTQAQQSGQLDRQNMLVDLIQNNLVELDSKPVASLPPVGSCSVRLYTITGTFVSESISSTDCVDIIPINPGMKIILTVNNIDPTSVKFKNSDGTSNAFLKLPSMVSTIMAVQIQAGMMDTATRKTSQLSMVVYKQ